jgi:serine/threonine protein kinase
MEIGKILKDRYTIRAKLNEGNITETFLATDQIELSDVVVKILLLTKAKDWKYIELFEREANTLETLSHKNMPDFIESFTIDYDNDKAYVTVQEYIKGINIEQMVKSGKRFTEIEIMNIMGQILKVLVYFQEQKPPIIHRDINPKNIIIDDKGKAYLVDLGGVQNYISTNVTDSSTVVGTFGYMSPEQTIGRANPSSDLYSLGMTALYMLIGKHPGLLEQENLKPNIENTALNSRKLSLILNLMIEPDQNKRITTAMEALEILKGNHDLINKYDTRYDMYAKLFNNKLPSKSKITINPTPEGVYIDIPKRFGRNLQGLFGNTYIILNTKYIHLHRSLGSLWKKNYKISINDLITCALKKRSGKKNTKTYLSLETYHKKISFGHNLSKDNQLFLRKIINEFIINFRTKKEGKRSTGKHFITTMINKIKNFIDNIDKW